MLTTYKIHRAALAFPRMPKREFDELKADIQAHGIRIPILVNKKKDTILDGRNRIMAAHDLKLPDSNVPIEVFKGTDEQAVAEIVSRNIHRRHLTDDERVSLLTKLLGPELSKAAALREIAGRADPGMKSTQGRVRDQLAVAAKVSVHKARSALAAAKHDPKHLDRVIEGKEKLADARKASRGKVGKTAKPTPQKSLRERVEAKYQRLMESFPPQDYREVRAILGELLAVAKNTSRAAPSESVPAGPFPGTGAALFSQ